MTTKDLTIPAAGRVPTRALLTGGIVPGRCTSRCGSGRPSPAKDSTSPGTRPACSRTAGPGWIQTTNFVVSGLLSIAAAVGLRRTLTGRGRNWAPRLLGGVRRRPAARGDLPSRPGGRLPCRYAGRLRRDQHPRNGPLRCRQHRVQRPDRRLPGGRRPLPQHWRTEPSAATPTSPASCSSQPSPASARAPAPAPPSSPSTSPSSSPGPGSWPSAPTSGGQRRRMVTRVVSMPLSLRLPAASKAPAPSVMPKSLSLITARVEG